MPAAATSAIAVPSVPSMVAFQPTAVVGGPEYVKRCDVVGGRVVGVGGQPRHPYLDVRACPPPPHTYEDVNIVKPNLFIPRNNDVSVALLEEHNTAVSAVDAKRVADGIAANSKWTSQMRSFHQHSLQSALLR